MSFEFGSSDPNLDVRKPSGWSDHRLLVVGYRRPGNEHAPCHISTEQVSDGARVSNAGVCPNFVVNKVVPNSQGRSPKLELNRTKHKISEACSGCPIVEASGVKVVLSSRKAG